MKEIAIKNVECKVSVVDKVKNAVTSWLHAKNHFISSVVEENVTNSQVLLMSNFGFSFMVICGSAGSVHTLLMSTAYMVFSYLLARKAGALH